VNLDTENGVLSCEGRCQGHAQEAFMGDEYRSLMVRYQAGDAQALYARLAPELRQLVRRRAPEASSPDDVVEQIFIELHRARGSYSPRTSFEPWLAAIVAHVVGKQGRPRGKGHSFGGLVGRLVSPRQAG
jgi:hypothetical protein